MLNSVVAPHPALGPAVVVGRRRLVETGRSPHFEIRRLAAREALFSRYEPAGRLHEVRHGVVMIHRSLADGRRQIVDIVGPGRLFGFSAGPRHDCTAQALTDTVVLSVESHAVDTDPGLALRARRAMVEEIGRLRDLALLLGRKSAIERVASFFLVLAEAAGVGMSGSGLLVLPVTRAEIGDHLGLTIETVSRNVTRLKRQGIIGLARGEVITITDAGALRDIASGSHPGWIDADQGRSVGAM